jgi:hypothetical protein
LTFLLTGSLLQIEMRFHLEELNSHRPDQHSSLVSSMGVQCPVYGSLSMDACGVKDWKFDILLLD